MSPVAVLTEAAPKAIGPYSQAIAVPAGPLVFCSGQIAIDPRTGELVGAGDIRQQTRRVLENLQAVLQAAGTSLANVVKTTIFLVDFGTSPRCVIYANYFSTPAGSRHRASRGACPAGRDSNPAIGGTCGLRKSPPRHLVASGSDRLGDLAGAQAPSAHPDVLRVLPTRTCTRRRLGRWMLLVLMFEWLTRLAICRCLPQISHCAGMVSPEGASISTC